MSSVSDAREGARAPQWDDSGQAGAATVLRHRLLARLHVDTESIVDTAWQQMVAVEPAYGQLGELQIEETRAGVRWVFGLFVSCLAEERGPTTGELETVRATGVVRARQDVALATVQWGFRVAFDVCYRRLVAAAEAEAAAGAAADVVATVLGELSANLIGLAFHTLDAIRAGYGEASHDHMVHQVRWESAAVESVLEGGHSEDELERLVVETSEATDRPRSMVVLTSVVASTPADVLGLSSQLADLLPGALLGHVRGHPVPHAVLLVGASPERSASVSSRMAQFGREHEAALLVASSPRLTELGELYRRVRDSVGLLSGLAGGGGVVPDSELRICQVLAGLDPTMATAWVWQQLGPLLRLPASQREPLISFLGAMVDGNGTVADAAQRLWLHRKGAAYRSRRVTQLTGLSPTVPSEWFRLALATRLLRLHPEAARTEIPETAEAGIDVVDLDQGLAGVDGTVATALVRQELGAILCLPASQRDRLLEMLDAMMDGDGTVAQAAEALGLSPGGVAHRNRRIDQLTGLNPTVPADWCRLALVIRLMRVHPAVPAPAANRGIRTSGIVGGQGIHGVWIAAPRRLST